MTLSHFALVQVLITLWVRTQIVFFFKNTGRLVPWAANPLLLHHTAFPTFISVYLVLHVYSYIFRAFSVGDTMSEWLRRQIRNLLAFRRVGSNPASVDSFSCFLLV